MDKKKFDQHHSDHLDDSPALSLRQPSKVRLTGRGQGSHTAYYEGPVLVIEWYDFGDDAPYESANMLRFDREAQDRLAGLLGTDLDRLLVSIRDRFATYFAAKDFANANGVPFTHQVDFQP